MFQCPLCEKDYPGKVPANCIQCKRPLVINGRYRIEQPIEFNDEWGEDFYVSDLKKQESVVLRELRVKKREMSQQRAKLDHYRANIERLKGMSFSGGAVLLNAFEAEFKNSICYYLVFSEDAHSELGAALHSDEDPFDDDFRRDDEEEDFSDLDDLGDLLGGEPGAAAQDTPKPKAPGKPKAPADAPPDDDLDDLGGDSEESDFSDDDLAFLESMLGDVDGGEAGEAPAAPAEASPKKSGADKKGGALVKASKDKPPAKNSSGGGSMLSRRPVQAAIGASILIIIIAFLAALL